MYLFLDPWTVLTLGGSTIIQTYSVVTKQINLCEWSKSVNAKNSPRRPHHQVEQFLGASSRWRPERPRFNHKKSERWANIWRFIKCLRLGVFRFGGVLGSVRLNWFVFRFGLTKIMKASALLHHSKISHNVVYTCMRAIFMTIDRERWSNIRNMIYAMWRWSMENFDPFEKNRVFSVRTFEPFGSDNRTMKFRWGALPYGSHD